MKQLYIKRFLLTFSLCLLFFAVSAQNSDELWTKSTGLEKSTTKKLARKSIPHKFETYQLNVNQLKSKLSKAPKRKENLEKSSTVLSFPNEKGVLEKFQIFEASILDENLQKQYPNIRSYVGKGIDNSGSTIRFSVTPLGLHAMVLGNAEGNLYIDPYAENSDSYIVYSSKNLPSIEPFECKFDEVNTSQKTSTTATSAKAENANDGKLRTFRLAVATTGEYSQFHLNRQNISTSATDAEKKAAVLSAISVTMTRVNGLFERDVALTMILVANNTNVIFLDAATDPFTNSDATKLINESQTVIDGNIGSSFYDIGHTFSTGGGGLAQLNSPCVTNQKARGITGSTSPIGDAYDIDYVAHEMGHQYGAHHTFNGDASNCSGSNRNTGTAVEPGSGSTIMAYAGLCAPQNVQTRADSYFHLVSIREMWANITTGSSTCAALSNTGNSAPVVNDLLNYTIPKSTPFILNANATDSNGDNLFYTWEQLDTEITTYPLVSTATVGPAFRSISPSSSSSRYFPNQATVNAGNLSNTWEVLPSVGRTMRFGVNVRDNNSVGGQTASQETVVTFSGDSGPFKVTSQSTTVTWGAGTSQTITWDVANSNLSPVSCAFVNILFSSDGGLTFPTTLIENVPNDGSQEIVVPNNATATGRIKVESVGNIFYSVNTKNITVQTSEFIMNFESYAKKVCIPNNAIYSFTYNTFLGFNEVTAFSATGHPVGSTVTFNPTTATSNNTNVQVTISGISIVGNYDISIKGTSASVSKTTSINLGVYSATVAAPTLVSPINNAVDVLKPFNLDWNDDINATSYNVQISENSNFGIILETANVNVSTYTPQNLQPKTTYFWRVKSINDCGESAFSAIFKFTTENEVCDINVASDVPKSIPDNNATGVSSIIAISANKIIRDVNVTVNITHPWIGDLDLTLISPSGKSVLLASNRQDDGDNYTNTVFDDSALNSLSSGTAPYTGTFKPEGFLSNFNDEESLGNWILKVVDSGPDDIGKIDSWSLEICGVPVSNGDDDNDGVQNSNDLCANTPTGETVNASGCSSSQLDDDNDGVMNNVDLCANTPIGETVNANGCSSSQLDDDNDGVMNNLDLCANTPIGETVNASGCSESQLDDDNDGVMNNADLCANTPVGQTVNTNGCSQSQLDDDNDGVQNSDDLCANTPIGETVNASGCSESQLDDDNDGVMNNLDLCANTPSGESVNASGCSTSQTDADADGVKDNVDICPNTPSGETVNTNGCSESQLDDDNDGVMNNADLCANTTVGQAVNANGCSSSQLDDDNDGVMNDVDQCPNTTPGSLVDAAGCFTLPANNFTVEVISETCPNRNNGKISISATETHNYIVEINGISTDGVTPINITDKTFTNNSLLLNNLQPGIYTVCISVSGETYEQCFEIKVIAGEEILANVNITAGKASVEIKKGTAPFTVIVNGQEQFETSAPIFSVDVKGGDILEVKTAVSCEGIYSKTIDAFEPVFAYPNPTQGAFEITVSTAQTEVFVELYNFNSQLISVKKYPVVYGKVQLSLANKPTGVYIAKVLLDQPATLKIIKQ